MKEDDLADIPDYVQSLPLIAKHLNCPKTSIVNLEPVPGCVFSFLTLGLRTPVTTPSRRE